MLVLYVISNFLCLIISISAFCSTSLIYLLAIQLLQLQEQKQGNNKKGSCECRLSTESERIRESLYNIDLIINWGCQFDRLTFLAALIDVPFSIPVDGV